jgi:hypothetical protein
VKQDCFTWHIKMLILLRLSLLVTYLNYAIRDIVVLVVNYLIIISAFF